MIPPNTTLHNRYRIIQQLGAGGMGAVYQAMDETLSCVVAVKETFAKTEDERRAFKREAELLANLTHPALPRVTDHFTHGSGQFLVMQFIPGNDLAELLTLRERQFATDKVLEWADTLLDALEELHSYRPPIIHRDIKPSNLKLTPKGKIILLDFGLAKGTAGQMSTVDADSSLKSMYGYTRNYAPLEQITGAGTDPRSDLYSLAATAWSLLTGELPPDVLTRVAEREEGNPDPLRPAHEKNADVPQAIADVLHQAMALNRNQRPASAVEMRKLLREASRTQAEAEEDRRRRALEEAARRLAEEETLRKREDEETARRNAEMRQRREALERQRAKEEEERRQAEAAQRAAEEQRRKEEAQAQAAAEAERRQAEGERRRAEQERLRREAEEAERKRAAELEEERTVEAQRTVAPPTQRAQESTPSDSLAVKTIKSPPPERVVMSDSESTSLVAAPANRNRRAMLIAMIALGALVVVVAVVLLRRGESNSNQSSGDNPTQTGQGAGVPLSNSNNAAAPSPAQSVAPPIEMVLIPAGTFLMGSPDGVGDKNEHPQHQVRLQSFYMGKYEVTQAQYRAVMGTNPSNFKGDNLPVENVSWDDAVEFCRKLSQMTRREYRLPSEAEWEYACRAGTTGDDTGNLDAMGWYDSNSGNQTHAVGTKQPNSFGLYDMHGNVWEWCEDWYHDNYNGAPTDGSAWLSGGEQKKRVLRGGSWNYHAGSLRSANRGWNSPDYRFFNFGFRVVALART